jgi:predicted RNA polymerase sigma factor
MHKAIYIFLIAITGRGMDASEKKPLVSPQASEMKKIETNAGNKEISGDRSYETTEKYMRCVFCCCHPIFYFLPNSSNRPSHNELFLKK